MEVLSNRMSVEVIKLKFKTLCSITMRLYTCVRGESLSDLRKVGIRWLSVILDLSIGSYCLGRGK